MSPLPIAAATTHINITIGLVKTYLVQKKIKKREENGRKEEDKRGEGKGRRGEVEQRQQIKDFSHSVCFSIMNLSALYALYLYNWR